MPYQSIGDFAVDVMMNQFNLSKRNYNDDSDLYEYIDLINLEKPIRLPSPHWINFFICLSAKHRRNSCVNVCLLSYAIKVINE